MTAPQLPPAGSFLPDAGSEDEVLPLIENWLAVTKQLPGAAPTADLTLDNNGGGRVVPTGYRHRVDTFGGAASGTLAKLGVDNMVPGRRVKLSIVSSLRPITFHHGGGTGEQLFLSGGLDMAAGSDTATLEVELRGDGWHETDRDWGTMAGAWRSWMGVKDQATLDLATQADAEAGVLNTVMMSSLRVRQAVVAPGWLASRPVATLAFPDNALLLYDGSGLFRVAIQTALLGAPHSPYSSGNLTITAGGQGTFAHGLGGSPRVILASLGCVADDGGWQAANGDTTIPAAGVFLWFNPTNLGYNLAVSAGGSAGVRVFNLNTGNLQEITYSSWKLRIIAFR